MIYRQVPFWQGVVFVLLIILTAEALNAWDTLAASGLYGSRPVGIRIDLAQTIYDPHDTVTIGVFSDTSTTIYLTIRDGMGEYTKPEGGFALENARILYSTKLDLTNQSASVNYTAPEDNNSIYRYLVVASDDITQNTPGREYATKYAMFFTRQDADKISVTDFTVDRSQFKPGGRLSFHATVLDGVGNPIPSVFIHPRIRPAENDGGVLEYNLSPSTRPDSEKRQYALDGSINGYFRIPEDFPNGRYYMEIDASTLYGATIERSPGTYKFPSPGPSDEQRQECEELGITIEECSDATIAQKRERMADQQNQINNSMYVIGIGASIAGAIAFMLRKRVRKNHLVIASIGSMVFFIILALVAFYPQPPGNPVGAPLLPAGNPIVLPVGNPVGAPLQPAGLAANPGTGHMILADLAGHAIFVLEKNNREILKKIPLAQQEETGSFNGPEIVVHSSSHLYAPNAPHEKISVLDDENYEVVQTIDIGEDIWLGTYDSLHQELYFVSQTTNSIFVISDTLRHMVAKIAVGPSPWGVAYNQDDGLVYVAILGDTADNAGVQVINTTNHEVVDMIPIDQDSPRFIAFDSANQRMYVTCGSGDVVVIDSTTRQVIKSITIPDTPYGYYIEENTGKHIIYSNFTQVLDSSTDRLASEPSEIIIVPDNYAYIVHSGVGVLSVIDLETTSVVAQIPTLPVGYGIAYNPSDGKIYLSHGNLYTVSAIPLIQKSAS